MRGKERSSQSLHISCERPLVLTVAENKSNEAGVDQRPCTTDAASRAGNVSQQGQTADLAIPRSWRRCLDQHQFDPATRAAFVLDKK